MKLEIHEAHAEAITSRNQQLQQIYSHFTLLQREEKRHVDAVIRTLGKNPDDFQNYELRQEDGKWFMDLHEKTVQPPPVATVVQPQQKANGAAQATA